LVKKIEDLLDSSNSFKKEEKSSYGDGRIKYEKVVEISANEIGNPSEKHELQLGTSKIEEISINQ